MNQQAEIDRMDAAFKRGADKAVNGTREERSGRFVMRDDLQDTRDSTHRPRKVVTRNVSET